MGAKVFFSPARGTSRRNKFDRLTELLDCVNAGSVFAEDELVAVKVHWGERGNADFLPSFFVRQIVSVIAGGGARPFITDSNTLYRGGRHDGVANLMTAAANGFTPATVGCPIIIADGLRGTDYEVVPVAGKHIKKAKIASAIAGVRSMVTISHVKGHMVFGFGGALKNLGMGCAATATKQFMHSDVRPIVNQAECTGCGTCAEQCRFQAIRMVTGPDEAAGTVARIDHEACSGCGLCIVICPEEAIPIDWGGDVRATQEKTAEYAAAAVAGKRETIYVNFLVSITPDCDCCHWSDAPLVPDIGYLVSTDPVAIDLASVRLVNTFDGFDDRYRLPRSKDRFRDCHDVDYMPLLEHAAWLKMGSLDYELIRLD